MTESKSIITGTPLLQALAERNLIDLQTMRVIIDISFDRPVVLYVEKFGDQRLLESDQIMNALMESGPILKGDNANDSP